MSLGRTRTLLIATAALACVLSAGRTQGGEPGVPLDSWVYRVLDRLRAAGLLESGTAGFRPRSRGEVARLVREARRLTSQRKEGRFEAGLARLESEFGTELEDVDAARNVYYFRPIDKVRASYLFMDGENDVQNDRGREYREHHNPRLSVSSRFGWKVFSGYVLWEGRYLEESDGDDQVTAARVEEGYLRLSAGKWYLEAGRESLWWGPGRHGSLLLSNNARPFDLVRFGNDQPVLLPGFLSRLGPVRIEGFLTRLEEDRVVSKPFMAGARLEVSPLPCLALGASRVVMLGGSGRSVTWNTVADVLSLEEENNSNQPGNQLASVDWRLSLPWRAQPFEFYGEVGGEDEAGGFFSREAYLLGLYLPRLGPSAVFDFRVEYADTYFNGHDGHPRPWYTHGTYGSGYTYEQRVIGHHMGTDAKDLYLELGFYPAEGVRVWASFDREKRELSSDDPEERREYAVGVEWAPNDRLVVEAAWLREDVDNLALSPGENEAGDRLHLAVTWKF